MTDIIERTTYEKDGVVIGQKVVLYSEKEYHNVILPNSRRRRRRVIDHKLAEADAQCDEHFGEGNWKDCSPKRRAKPFKWTAKAGQKVRRLRREGRTRVEIANELGCTVGQLDHWLKKNRSATRKG